MLLLVVVCLTRPALADPGETIYDTLFSPAMDKEMNYAVHTPPDFQPSESLPLVVMLHGAGGSHKDFEKYEVAEYLQGEMAQGRSPRAVILTPDGGLGFWENWKDGSRSYRDWVVDDLMPVVQERYGTAACPDHCHVMGVSMGAHGALRFSFHEPETFTSVTAISGMILSREEVKPTLRRAIVGWFIPYRKIWGDLDDPSSGPRELDPYIAWTEVDEQREKDLFLAWGDREKGRIRDTNERFRDTLLASDLDFRWTRYRGGHRWDDWKPVIAEALRVQLDDGASTDTNAQAP